MPLYCIKLCIGITTSMSLALSTCILFISLMQSVNGAQFVNIMFLSILFAAANVAAVFSTVIVPLTHMYASL